jgi:uncharacterized protein (TIGR02246 family)
MLLARLAWRKKGSRTCPKLSNERLNHGDGNNSPSHARSKETLGSDLQAPDAEIEAAGPNVGFVVYSLAMPKRLLCFFFLCWLQVMPPASHRAHAQDQAFYGNEKRAIERVLNDQQKAWNRHDLEAFMAGYWKSSDLTFFSGTDERDGWQAALERYLAAYASPGRSMGSLQFSNLRVQVMGQDCAFVRGAWKLTMPDGKTPHGLFTLVFRKFPEGWKIIHDHTSVAPA